MQQQVSEFAHTSLCFRVTLNALFHVVMELNCYQSFRSTIIFPWNYVDHIKSFACICEEYYVQDNKPLHEVFDSLF